MKRPPTQSELEDLEAINYSECERDLGLFVHSAWDVLEPGVRLKWNWHHDLICEHLQAVELGQIQRLIINVAPRSTKSLITTVSFPAWVWLRNPKARFLFGSYADTLATKHSILRRNIIESPWYQTGYSQRFRLSDDVNTKSDFTNNHTGQMKAAGIKGSVIGEGGDYIIIDDPHNPKGAESDLDRESVLQGFDLGWSTRLNDKKTGKIIVIMQRLHDRDLTGHLLEKGGYTHLKIPSVAEERTTVLFPVSKKTIVREQGEFMHPERDGPAEIEQAKQDLGPYGFSGQHQQDPTPASGGLFKDHMFDFLAPPDQLEYRFITADTAYTDKQSSDFTAFAAWGFSKGELYLLDLFKRQINASEVEAVAVSFIKRFQQYGFRGAYIEPKGHGIYLNQALPKHGVIVPGEVDRREFFSDRKWDKVARASNVVPHLAARRVHINPNIPEKESILSEVLRFPKAPHDDVTDCIIDGVKFAFSRTPSILDVL